MIANFTELNEEIYLFYTCGNEPHSLKSSTMKAHKGAVKLYTIYSGPQHLRDTIQLTKTDEEENHFNGITNLED